MNWQNLTYFALFLILTIGLYIQNKKWRFEKKKNGGLNGFDKGTINPRDWLLLIVFGTATVVYLFKFLFN
jgi:hypothetical protein